MLVTMRRKGDVLLIGDDIELVIVDVGRSRVRVGIRAPREYRITPGEDAPAAAGPETGEPEVLS